MEINKQGKYENSEKGILGNGADSILGAMFWSTDYVGERNRQLLQLLEVQKLQKFRSSDNSPNSPHHVQWCLIGVMSELLQLLNS